MKAANITHSAALGYGLGVARAVGRNAHHLRQALAAHRAGHDATALCDVPTADLVKLRNAGLAELAGEWSLTAEGRTLAGRL